MEKRNAWNVEIKILGEMDKKFLGLLQKTPIITMRIKDSKIGS